MFRLSLFVPRPSIVSQCLRLLASGEPAWLAQPRVAPVENEKTARNSSLVKPPLPLNHRSVVKFLEHMRRGLSPVEMHDLFTYLSSKYGRLFSQYYDTGVTHEVAMFITRYIKENHDTIYDPYTTFKVIRSLRSFGLKPTAELQTLIENIFINMLNNPIYPDDTIIDNIIGIVSRFEGLQLSGDFCILLAKKGSECFDSFDSTKLTSFFWFWTRTSAQLSVISPETLQKWFEVSSPRLPSFTEEDCNRIMTAINKEQCEVPEFWLKAFADHLLSYGNMSTWLSSLTLNYIANGSIKFDKETKEKVTIRCIKEIAKRNFVAGERLDERSIPIIIWSLGTLGVNPDKVVPEFLTRFWTLSYPVLPNIDKDNMVNLVTGLVRLDCPPPPTYYLEQLVEKLKFKEKDWIYSAKNVIQFAQLKKMDNNLKIDKSFVEEQIIHIFSSKGFNSSIRNYLICRTLEAAAYFDINPSNLVKNSVEDFLSKTISILPNMEIEPLYCLIKAANDLSVKVPDGFHKAWISNLKISDPDTAGRFLFLLNEIMKKNKVIVDKEHAKKLFKICYSGISTLSSQHLIGCLFSITNMGLDPGSLEPRFWDRFWAAADLLAKKMKPNKKKLLLICLLNCDNRIPDKWLTFLIQGYLLANRKPYEEKLTSIYTTFEVSRHLDESDLKETVEIWIKGSKSVNINQLSAVIQELILRKEIKMLNNDFWRLFQERTENLLPKAHLTDLFVLSDLVCQFEIKCSEEWWKDFYDRLKVIVIGENKK